MFFLFTSMRVTLLIQIISNLLRVETISNSYRIETARIFV